jgi:TonB family protein
MSRPFLYTAIATGLLFAGCATGRLGYTPMMNAAAMGNEDQVRRALTEGADVNARAADGSTALMRAALGGHVRIVGILLEAGADTGLESKDGWTAIRLAAAADHQAIANRLGSSDPEPTPVEETSDLLRADHPGLTVPRLLKQVQPSFTNYALDRKVEGEVVVEVIIQKSGAVIPTRILKSLELGLHLRAIQAARQWQFEPARLDGAPVDLLAEIVVDFNIL